MPEDLQFIRDDGFFRNVSLNRIDRLEEFSIPNHREAIEEANTILAMLE